MQIGRCKWYDDDDGRCIDVRVDAPDGTWVFGTLHREDERGEVVIQGRVPDYRTSDGHFLVGAQVDDERARLYLPWTAVEKPSGSAKRDVLVLVAAAEEGASSERQRFEIEIRATPEYSKFHIVRPLLGLGLAVAYADGVLQQAEVRCLREVFVNTLGLQDMDAKRLRDAMYECPPRDLRPLARAALYRSPRRSAAPIIQILEMVAGADGRITEDELGVIEQVARELQADPALVHGIRQRVAEGASQDDPWRALGVSKQATADEVKKAYRRIIAEYHPDRWATAPAKFRELANEETRRATEAYSAILSRINTPSPVGHPRPEVAATYAAYGVRETVEWTEWLPMAPPAPIAPRPASMPVTPPAPPPDPLAGYWADVNGNRILFTAQPNGYNVEEFGVLGKVSEGWATRNGLDVQMTIRNVLLGQYSTQLRITGPLMVGRLSILGFPLPISLHRV